VKFAIKLFHAELYRHMRAKHAFAKEHVCIICNKSFATNDILACHMKIHDLKPVSEASMFCGKIFAYKSSLVFHVKSHTDENNIKYDRHLYGPSLRHSFGTICVAGGACP